MRSLCNLFAAGFLLLPMVFGQEAGSVMIDILTLKMPAELAAQLQKRVEHGGPAAATAVDRLPDLAKDKKLTELDRWHAVTGSSEVSKRTILRGADLKTKDGEVVPAATVIEIEPTLGNHGAVHVRMAIDSSERIEGAPTRYLSWQIATALTAKANEWIALGCRRDGEQSVLFLGKFSGVDDPASSDSALQASLTYSLCRLETNAPPGRLSGEPARELLKKAKVLEAGSLGVQENSQSAAHRLILPLDGKDETDPPNFTLQGCFCFAADRKSAEAKIIAEYTPPRAEGKSGKFAFAEWMGLPVGTVTLIPVNPREKLFLALELKVDAISSDPEKSALEVVWVCPSARRLLATAAGLPVPKPEYNKPGFVALPKISESLAKLGLELPPGVRLLESETSIRMLGKNAPYDRLKEILAKHLPPAACPPGE